MINHRAKKYLSKKAKKGFQGYPIATIALYGPTDKKATKLVIGIIPYEGAEPEPMKKWYSENEIENEPIHNETVQFIQSNNVKSVAMADRIIGCPHEEGIDYPKGNWCPHCPYWHGRNRWTGEHEH